MQKLYLTASDVAILTNVSLSTAYKIIRESNNDLKSKGYMTIAGRVPTEYFKDHFYGVSDEKIAADLGSV